PGGRASPWGGVILRRSREGLVPRGVSHICTTNHRPTLGDSMSYAPLRSSVLGLSAMLLVASGGTGCAVLKSIVGKNSVDLSKAQMQKVAVDIRKPQKTICPRERVQLVVVADMLLEGKK